mmetsp:Transcript_3045/g.4652  ORF Transcript_3045/g.4652 Transcript_3045/m.4652 type:complete len:356 (+) Transcript_3045:27-1094(+)
MFIYFILVLCFIAIVRSDESCVDPGTCIPPNYKYISGRDVIPRYQWTISGGFCGSVSIQSIALSYGMWVSQDLVRKAAPAAEGHGNPIEGYEILHSNIEPALKNLHLSYVSWDWEGEPQPQGNNYLAWLKKQLASGFGVVQFVLCKGDGHNAYGTDDDPNLYDHIEPFFKLYSNHPMDDLTVYDDDIVNHGSDYSPDGDNNYGYFRNFSSLLDDLDMDGNCRYAQPGWGYNEMYPCLYQDRVYGYSMTGLEGSGAHGALPLKMFVNNTNEPNIRNGEDAVLLQAQVIVSDLTPTNHYVIYRWESYQDFPTDVNISYGDSKYSFFYEFEASSTTYEFYDQNLFWSSGSVVYACVEK